MGQALIRVSSGGDAHKGLLPKSSTRYIIWSAMGTMVNEVQQKNYKFICDEIKRLRGPESYVQPTPKVTDLESAGDRATFRVNGAQVFIENSGELTDHGMPDDCPRYANCLLQHFLPAIAVDLLREGNPHKPFLDSNSHTPGSFKAYLQTGVPFEKGKEFPSPIAIVSRRLGNEANGMRSFFLLCDLFEVAIRFIVLVQIAEVMRGSESQQSEAIARNSGLEKLSETKTTLGVWVNLFRQLRRFPTENPFLKEIKAIDIKDKWLEDFKDLRNNIKGHGPTLAEAYYKSIFEQNIGKLEQLLRTVSFLKNYWLVKPFPTVCDGTHHRIPARNLMGDNPIFDIRHIHSPNELPTDEVIYLSGLEPLTLHPYVILEMCKECDREELLLFDGFSKESEKDIKYLGYESCPKLERDPKPERYLKRHKSYHPYAYQLPRVLREAIRYNSSRP
jgi:hypothetical protein